MLPLNDAYIHLQYAWQAARGQFMQYNPGDTPTSGATSLLYMLLLALGFLAGLSKETMPAAVLVLGVALYVISSVTLADLARRTARQLGLDEKVATLAAIILFAGSGWMAWSFLSGMETGLLIALVSVTLWAQLTRRLTLMAIASGLAALTRPEAALLPLVILAAEIAFRDRDARWPMRRAAGMAAALGLAVVPVGVNYFFTGSFSASGLSAKSLFTLVPFEWSAIVSGWGTSLMEVWVRLFGGLSSDGHWHTFPLLQIVAAASAVVLARNPGGRRLAFICAAWLVLGTAATATLQTATWHHYRYQMPFYPALVLLVSLAGGRLAATWLRGQRAAALTLLVPLVVWSAYSILDFSKEYSRDTQTAAQMQLPLALWLREHTPAGARVAVHDIGIVRYFSERATIDVVGLTTTGMAPAYRNGPGSLLEAFERLEPDFYAVYPNLAPPYFGISSAPALLGQELFQVHVPNYSRVTSAGDRQVITQPDWSKTTMAEAPQQPSTQLELAGLTLVDHIDVADLLDEQAHGYAWWDQGEPAGFPTDARVMAYRQDPTLTLADGGRVLTGGESFSLAVKPATPLALVARVHQTANMTLEVTVNQNDLGEWRLPAIPGQWLESSFAVDPKYLAGNTAKIVLTIKTAAVGATYSPFYYWAYQGVSASQVPIAPQQPSAAVFGSIAQLVGFDAPSAANAGQRLDLTLYWRTRAPDQADYRVFVHLVNRADDTAAGIVAQSDAAPLAGTEPFWAWPPGATLRDSLRLDIPGQTKPGSYVLLAGIYNADTGERLPVSGAPDFGSARLLLGQVEIR
jgi:hypothetical protein